MESNKLPIDVQDFETLRTGGFVYVDKTKQIYELFWLKYHFFLLRPPQFGKTLLISTIAHICRGRRDLFDGTWIASSDYDWPTIPVMHIDMGELCKEKGAEAFKAALKNRLLEIGDEYDVVPPDEDYPRSMYISYYLRKIAKISRSVVLIDNYDMPLQTNRADKDAWQEIHRALDHFYCILKSHDGEMQFSLYAGVTRCMSAADCTGLNHVYDLTNANDGKTLCGFTDNELDTNFAPWIKKLAQKTAVSEGKALAEAKKWYGGYQFSEADGKLFNPFSILSLFEHQVYQRYWLKREQDAYLYELLEENKKSISGLDEDSILLGHLSYLEGICFVCQIGLITINSYDESIRAYELHYPNDEARMIAASLGD